jgi:hypothetical protein
MLKNAALLASILLHPLSLVAHDTVLTSSESTFSELITIQDILTRKVKPSEEVELCSKSVHHFLKNELHTSTTAATPINCSYSRLTVNIDGLHAYATNNSANDLKKFVAHQKYTYNPKASDLTATGECIYKLIGSSLSQSGMQGQVFTSSFTIIAQCPSTLSVNTAYAPALKVAPSPSGQTIASSINYQPAIVSDTAVLKNDAASFKADNKKPARSFSQQEKPSSVSCSSNSQPAKARSNSSGPRLLSSLFNKSKNLTGKKEINNQIDVTRLIPVTVTQLADSYIPSQKFSVSTSSIGRNPDFAQELKKAVAKRNVKQGKH